MSEFAVNTESLRGCATQLTGVESQLEEIQSRLRMLQLGCVLQIRASSTMISRLQECANAVSNQGNDLGKLSEGLTAVAALYDTYERRLSEPSTGEAGQNAGAGEDASADWLSTLAEGSNEVVGLLLRLLGRSNAVFGILNALFNFGQGEHASGLRYGFNSLARIFDAFDGNGSASWFDTLMGFTPNTADDLGDAWSRWLNNMGLGDSSNTNGASVVCRWLGYAMSFVAEGVSNYQEYDGDMGVRFWSETLLEGVVDVGVGVGVGLLASALLPATWPAIAVGAVGGLVIWGVDSVCEWITGEDLSDLIVDPILDTAENVIDGVVDVAQDVGRAIVDGAEAVCNWFGNLF